MVTLGFLADDMVALAQTDRRPGQSEFSRPYGSATLMTRRRQRGLQPVSPSDGGH
jgi:hypothetical protein